MTTRSLLSILAALTVVLVWAAEPLMAQGGGQGPPSRIAPLHDRGALPPGRPFSGGAFDPPGRGLAMLDGTDENVVVLGLGVRSMLLHDVRAIAAAPQPIEWASPGLSANTPAAFGARFGQIWSGGSYQPRARYSDGPTGAVGFGAGVGDPDRWVGLQVGVISFSTSSSGFWNRGGVDLHLHRNLGSGWAVAAGRESALHWGGTRRDSGASHYAVVSRAFHLVVPGSDALQTMVSLGVGDGRFQSETAFVGDQSGVGVFGSAAVRIAPPVTGIAEWTGQDLTLAASMTPFRDHGLAITAGVSDLTGRAGDGARVIFGMSHLMDLRSP